MEQRIVPETLRHVEELLRDFEKDKNLRIENGVEKAGTNPGDNYLSYVVRVRLTGIRGNGHPYENNVIIKRMPHHLQNLDLIRIRDFFMNEVHVYTKMIPQIGLDFISAKCLEANDDGLMMEDLCQSGYKMCDRRDLLDFEHCQATIKVLARLHARSLMYKLKNPDEFKALIDPLKEVAFPLDSDPSIGQTINQGCISGIANLESIVNPDENIRRAIKFLNSHVNDAYERMRDVMLRRDAKYHVMTHGDTWNNNILFKHDKNGRVADVKFVDFQVVRHNSPAIDFHNFVYTSPRSSVIDNNYDDLVKIYQSSLSNEMKNYGASDDVLQDLSLEWFKEELRKTSMFGLYIGLWMIGALLADSDEIPDINYITSDYLAGRTNYEHIVCEKNVERTKCIVLHYCRTYMNLT